MKFPNPNVSPLGSGRYLRRHGKEKLRDPQVKAAKSKSSIFKAYRSGYPHIDVKYPQPRATRWAFVGIFTAMIAADAQRFLRDPERACAMRIQAILAVQRQGVHGSSFWSAQARRDGQVMSSPAPARSSTSSTARPNRRRQTAMSDPTTNIGQQDILANDKKSAQTKIRSCLKDGHTTLREVIISATGPGLVSARCADG